jgi:hypothetical protein
MGTLLYGTTGTQFVIDDRALAHLQVVITSKLRRGESLVFTWIETTKGGSGRSSVWMSPSSEIVFGYFGNRSPTLNREWIEVLMTSANSAGGLHLSAEPPLVHSTT